MTTAVPSLDVVSPDGERITIRPGSADDRVGDLVRALHATHGRTLTIDGEAVADHRPLRSIGRLRHGSVLGLVTDVAPPASPAPSGDRIADRARTTRADGSAAARPDHGCIDIAVSAGPACSATVELSPGRHWIGRSAGSAVTVADPAVEPHHGVLDVAADGRVAFTQLTGRVPARIDGRPADGPMELTPGSSLLIGSSVLRIGGPGGGEDVRASGSILAVPGDPWRRIVRRGPPHVDRLSEAPLAPPPDAAQQPRPPATGLIGAGVGVAGALAIGSLLGQSMFVLFALIGAFASLATWFAGVVTARRRNRRARDEARRSRERFFADLEARRREREEAHRAQLPTITATLDSVSRQRDAPTSTTARWNRRVDEAHPLVAVIGEGDLVGSPLIDDAGRDRLDPSTRAAVERAERLEDAPAPIVLAPDSATAIRGDRDVHLAVARSIIVQLAAWSGPADWHLVIVTRRPRTWRWAEWLPHLGDSSGERAVFGIDDGERLGAAVDRDVDPRALLVIVDDLAALTSRTGPLRRFLGHSSAAALVLVGNGETVPSICSRTLTIGTTANASWEGDGGFAAATSLRIAGIDEPTAATAARRLAPLLDPELGSRGAGELPTDLRLTDLADGARTLSARAIADRWAVRGADPPVAAAIGASTEGSVDIDLVRDGPHGLIAGTTGAGKSELLRTLVVALAAEVGPDHLSFVLVDYKGGSTFDACTDLPHTVGVVTDLDGGLAERALVSLDAELRRREEILREVAASDLTEYRSRPGVAPLPRLVVVVDEFAAMAKELPEFVASLVGLAQRGRSLGVHLLLATQRPSGVVSDEIRANTNLRIALRLNDRAEAHDVIGDETPSRFSRALPGRVAMRLGPDELVVFQAARCSAPPRPDGGRLRVERVHPDSSHGSSGECGECGEDDAPARAVDVVDGGAAPSELRAAVAAIRDAARRAGVAAPHRPWCPPLPERLAPSDLASQLGGPPARRLETAVAAPLGAEPAIDAVGVLDDPANQRRRPLRWRAEAGNLALIGSLGSGTTSTLLAVAAANCRAASADRLHLYAIDANGDPVIDRLSTVAHCGAVVRPRDRERLARLLRRLVDEIDARASLDAPTNVRIVLLIDGLAALRTALSSIDDAPRLAELERVLTDGPSVGVATAFTVDGVAPCAATTPAAERWLFHIDDPAVARGLGASGAPVPADVPGRMTVASSGLAGHVAHTDDVLGGLPHRGPASDDPEFGASDVVTLPEVVAAADLPMPTTGRGPTAPDERSPLLLTIGLSADDLVPVALRLPLGEHALIGGVSGTGKSVALARLVAAWRAAVPDGRVVLGSPSRSLTRADLVAREPAVAHTHGTTAPRAGTSCLESSPTLLAIDDGDRVDDTDGVLREVLDGRHPNVMIAVAASLDAVRAGYGHWTRDVARSRCGLIMTAPGDIDGDLLGVSLPRRTLIAPRPGLAWLVDGVGHRLVQVAIDR